MDNVPRPRAQDITRGTGRTAWSLVPPYTRGRVSLTHQWFIVWGLRALKPSAINPGSGKECRFRAYKEAPGGLASPHNPGSRRGQPTRPHQASRSTDPTNCSSRSGTPTVAPACGRPEVSAAARLAGPTRPNIARSVGSSRGSTSAARTSETSPCSPPSSGDG